MTISLVLEAVVLLQLCINQGIPVLVKVFLCHLLQVLEILQKESFHPCLQVRRIMGACEKQSRSVDFSYSNLGCSTLFIGPSHDSRSSLSSHHWNWSMLVPGLREVQWSSAWQSGAGKRGSPLRESDPGTLELRVQYSCVWAQSGLF